jgi:hypothetical protein
MHAWVWWRHTSVTKEITSYLKNLTLLFILKTCLQRPHYCLIYKEEPVNRSQMDIKREPCDIRTRRKHIFLDISSTINDTLVQSLYQCVETRSIEAFWLFSSTSAPPSQPFGHQLNVLLPSGEPLYANTLPIVKRKHFFMNILYVESYCAQKETHNRVQLFGNTLIKHIRHFYCWNQPRNMRMRICYLDCHESGLCCYLVIRIVNLLRPLQLFYVHL